MRESGGEYTEGLRSAYRRFEGQKGKEKCSQIIKRTKKINNKSLQYKIVFKAMSVEKYSGFGSQNALQEKVTGKNNPGTMSARASVTGKQYTKKEGNGAPTLQGKYSDTTEPLGILKQKPHLTS